MQVGGNTPVEILAATAIEFGNWYYLAITWDETRDNVNGPEVTWYLAPAGGTLSSGTINLTDTAVVGNDAASVHLGNRDSQTQNRSLRRSGSNGALDQIAFWNRELTGPEVNAQFNMLTAVSQGPSKVFDLTRWNLLLPVDKFNNLESGLTALGINTGWLNSGFKYFESSTCTSPCTCTGTRKYFYRDGNTMVFEAPYNGAPGASGGTSPWGKARSELRETLANGSDHNWTASSEGGTHILNGTCRVNVAGTGKVVIGQIHSDTAPPVSGVPAVILHYDTRVSPAKIIVTVKHHPHPANQTEENLQTTHDFTGVGLNEDIVYQLKMDNDPAPVTLHVTVNGEEWPFNMNANVPTGYSWNDVAFYFKAGCYYPEWTGRTATPPQPGVTAKVTFSSLTVTP